MTSRYDSDVSPVGWYVGTYQLRFIELDDPDNDDPQAEFLVWENTALIRADSLEEAYRKLVAIGEEQTEPYKGGPEAVDVQWRFEGVTDLLPVYEELGDGVEIMWGESHRTLKRTRSLARTVEQLRRLPRDET